jgi:nitrate/nitrite transport system substrate-binding protein
MKDLGQPFTAGPTYIKHKIMGKEFDPAKADAYAKSFAIRKTA